MDAFTWSAKYLTGLAVVDEQHQRLVQLVNDFGELTARGTSVSPSEVETVFTALAAYTQVHFRDEEQLMSSRGLDPRFTEHHARQHRAFLSEVTALRRDAAQATEEASRTLLRFLINWLAFHILGSDQQMARQLTHLEQGRSAAEAYALEVHGEDASSGLLLGAVDDLLRLLGQRNHQLQDANAHLEERVAQRTAELSRANEELTRTLGQLKATQQQLVESEKLASVGQLASGLAHEINNPLGFIRSNVAALGDGAARALAAVDAKKAAQDDELGYFREDLPDLLKETHTGLERVQAIVRDLKEFSRVDEAAVQPVDLARAVTGALAVLPPARRSGVTFETRFDAVPPVPAHGAQLNQALFNLLTNAALAVQDTKRPGTVTVHVGQRDGRALVEIADTGVGLSEDVRAHLFEPFFTTRPPGQGLGLGLSVAWSCAQKHGGALEGEGAVGKGATFRLWLPLEGRGPASAEDAVRSNVWNQRRVR